jgi:hypothetical protein
MKALIIVDGWEKVMDIPDHCYDQGWVIVPGPMIVGKFDYKKGSEVTAQELYQFDCIATGHTKNNLPVFEA